jgi:archaellum component FlaC
VAAIGEKHRDVEEQRKKVQGEMLVSAGNALQFEKQIQGMKDLQKESENEIKRIKEEQNKVSGVGTRIIADGASEIAEHEAKIKALKTSILSLTNNLLAPEKARTDQAAKTLAELKKQEFS